MIETGINTKGSFLKLLKGLYTFLGIFILKFHKSQFVLQIFGGYSFFTFIINRQSDPYFIVC